MIRRLRRVDSAIAIPIIAVVLTLIAALILLAVLLPYRPFTLKSYTIKPSEVCTGGEVTTFVTRKFDEHFNQLHLEEVWTTKEVPGLEPGLPVQSAEGSLPPEALHPTGGFDTVPSPLVDEAPDRPGLYVITITATAYGERWGIPVHGEATYTSNTVLVKPCPDKGEE